MQQYTQCDILMGDTFKPHLAQPVRQAICCFCSLGSKTTTLGVGNRRPISTSEAFLLQREGCFVCPYFSTQRMLLWKGSVHIKSCKVLECCLMILLQGFYQNRNAEFRQMLLSVTDSLTECYYLCTVKTLEHKAKTMVGVAVT